MDNLKFNKYLVDCIDNSSYSDTKLRSFREKVEFLYNTFQSEYSYNLEKYGMPRAFAEWCAGLPSSFNIAFADDDILRLCVEFKMTGTQYNKLTDGQCRKLLDTWFTKVSVQMLKLFKKQGLES